MSALLMVAMAGAASFALVSGAERPARAAIIAGVAAGAQIPRPASVVRTKTYVSLEPVPRGREFQVAVVVAILEGYHMNSHHPSEEYLIPTSVTAQLPAGFELKDTLYPSGEQQTFAFSPDKPLDVYTGTVTLRLRIAAKADAPTGEATIPISLRYQACNNNTCLPPVRVPVTASFTVAGRGAPARELHPEIFSELKKLN